MGKSPVLPPLETARTCENAKFMGTWFVIGVKPTMFEKTCSNAVEAYTWQEKGSSYDIKIDFQYNQNDPIHLK